MDAIILLLSAIFIVFVFLIKSILRKTVDLQDIVLMFMSIGALISALIVLIRIMVKNISFFIEMHNCKILTYLLNYQMKDDYYIAIACFVSICVYCKSIFSLIKK